MIRPTPTATPIPIVLHSRFPPRAAPGAGPGAGAGPGQEPQGEISFGLRVRAALSLAPQNRFVLRSAARILLHLEEREEAHAILARADGLARGIDRHISSTKDAGTGTHSASRQSDHDLPGRAAATGRRTLCGSRGGKHLHRGVAHR